MPLARSLRRTSWRWFPQLDALRAFVAGSRRPPRLGARLALEQLEDYSLPSSSITGGIWNDLNGDGLRQPVELGLAARVAYLDFNHDGRFDTTTATRDPASTAIALAPGALGGFGGFMSSLQAQGLSGTLVNLAVTMDLTNNGAKSVVVAVVSPTGLTVPNLPNLFTIRPGEHFVGTFDGNSTNSVATAPRPLPPGTYAPEQSFATPLSYVNGTDPNGTWGLVFFGDTSKLDLKSWSLTFTTTEPSALTDAQGNYSFQGLAPGTYDVRVALSGADAQTAPAGGAAQTVQAIDGRDATGVDFGVQPAPDLTPVAFSVKTPATAWGQDVTVGYTVANQGGGAAGAFDVDVRLSPDGRIGSSGLLLGTIHLAGLAAGSATSGLVTVRLPSAAPPGFGSAGSSYLGALVDSSNAIAEANETNNGNQGAGIDLARVDGTNGVAPNVPVVTAGEVQQAPTLAVDPTDSRHLVAAYLDAPFSGAYTGLSVSESTDGGATWGPRTPIDLPAGFDEAAAAPTVVFDAAGNVHVSFMAVTFLGKQPVLPNPDSTERADGFTANNGVFVVSRAKGASTWGAPQEVASNLSPLVTTVQDGGPGVAEVQSVRVPGGTGPYTLAFGTEHTGPLARNAPAAEVQNALNAIPTVKGKGSVTVTAAADADGVTYTVTFDGGLLANSDQPELTSAVPFETFPSMAADTAPKLADGVTANPNFGNLYVTWSRFYPLGQFPGQPGSTSGSDVMVAVLRPGETSWTTLTQTDPDTKLTRSVILDPRYKDNGTGGTGRGFVTFPTVTVGAGGDVFVSTYAGGDFTVYHSSNGGRAFTPPSYDGQTGLPFPTLNGIIVPSPTLPSTPGLAGMRTLPLRQIVADPAHPGRLYAVAVSAVTARVGPQAGQAIDPGDVLFASSDDYGQTWTSNFTILKQPPAAARLTPAQIASYAPTLNDDNAGEPAGIAEDPATQVLAGQALPSLAVDAEGHVVVVWYDSRTGPLAPNNTGVVNSLAVWGTVSADGGRTFSPNFQISDTPFDPVAGRFVGGDGSLATYLGDQIGVAIADGNAYVVWADARDGRGFNDDHSRRLRQDIYLGTFALAPAPAAPTDRFAPNNTPDLATELGFVSSPLDLAKLVLTPGQAEEWFHLEAGANGPLTVTATGGRPGDLQLEVTSDSGAPVSVAYTDVTDSSGAVVGKRAGLTASFGDGFLVHVSGANDNALPFALSLNNLTADLGTQVQGSVAGTLDFGQDVYKLTAGVTGSLTLKLNTSDPNAFQALIVLTPNGFTPLFDGTLTPQNPVTIQAAQGQSMLLLVVGDPSAYTLDYANTDQYSSTGSSTLFLPTPGDPASVAVADFNGDGIKDLIATTTDRSDVVSVFLGNGDGTFQAPRLFDVGAGLRGTLTADNRQPVVTDVNGDGVPDVVVPNFRAADVSVLVGRGDGTFQPQERTDAVTSPDFTATGDFNGDGNADLVVLQNFPQLGSVSKFAVLMGHGDGTFDPAVYYKTAFTNGAGPVLAADFTGDGKLDLIVFSKNTPLGELYRGNGDGTFTESGTFRTPENAFTVQAVDLDGDGKLDLVYGGTNSGNVYTALGNGDGTFQPAQKYTAMVAAPGDNVGVRSVALLTDYVPANEIQSLAFVARSGTFTLTVQGKTTAAIAYSANVGALKANIQTALDNLFGANQIVVGGSSVGAVTLTYNGPKVAARHITTTADVTRLVAADTPTITVTTTVADVTPATPAGAATKLGTHALVLTAASRSGQGPAQVLILPELVLVKDGSFAGFSPAPLPAAQVKSASNLATGDFDGDGKTDVAVVDSGGLTVVYGISAAPPSVPANTTPATARQLSTVTHYVTPTLSVVSGHEDSYFKFTVPTESASGSGDQVVDVSAAFQYQTDPQHPLQMEVLDAGGHVIATGARVRVTAAQGAELTVHIFGRGGGAGAYTLDIDVLPQVVSAEAHAFLPGGPATSIVLTLQGDRLDPATAEDPANYTVTWMGPSGQQVIPVASLGGGQPVVYDPGANVGVSSGVTFPTNVRQTVTLLFAQPLPAGSYTIALSPNVQTAPFAPGEAALLAGGLFFADHPVVSASGAGVANGATLIAPNLVNANGAPGSLSQFNAGTPFLTQLQNDLGAQLDALLRELGDAPQITPAVMNEILARVLPGLNPDGSDSLLIIWLDPVSINLADSEGSRTVYNEGSRSVAGGLANTFVEVGGNIELIVVAGARGTFTLNVGDVGDASRGGAALIDGGATRTAELTDALRAGTDRFEFSFGSPAAGAALSGAPGAGASATGAATADAFGQASTNPVITAATASATTVTINLLLTTLVSPPNFTAPGPGKGSDGGESNAAAQAGAAAASGTSGTAAAASVISGSSDGKPQGGHVGALGEAITSMFTRWGGDKFGDAVRSTLSRFVELAAVAKQEAGDRGAAPDAPGGKDNQDKPKGTPVGRAAPETDDAPAADAVAAAVRLPVAPAPLPKITTAVPGLEAAAGDDAVPTPAAGGTDTRRLASLGGVMLASLLGVHLVERRRPDTRGRTREAWSGELPRADQP